MDFQRQKTTYSNKIRSVSDLLIKVIASIINTSVLLCRSIAKYRVPSLSSQRPPPRHCQCSSWMVKVSSQGHLKTNKQTNKDKKWYSRVGEIPKRRRKHTHAAELCSEGVWAAGSGCGSHLYTRVNMHARTHARTHTNTHTRLFFFSFLSLFVQLKWEIKHIYIYIKKKGWRADLVNICGLHSGTFMLSEKEERRWSKRNENKRLVRTNQIIHNKKCRLSEARRLYVTAYYSLLGVHKLL